MIDTTILGDRIKLLRTTLGLSQEILAHQTKIDRSAISRFESGKGGALESLIEIVNFFSNFYVVDHFFASRFDVREINTITDSDRVQSIASERIKLMHEQFNEHIEQLTALLAK